MASFNKVILVGNLTRDPQLSYLPSNTAVCEFGLATNRKWRSPDGELREETCFVEVSCFGKQAETLQQYVRKGNPLFVEGRLKYHAWEAKDGTKRNKLTVVVDTFQFLGAAGGGGGGRNSAPSGEGESGGYRQTAPAQSASQGAPAQDDFVPDYSGGDNVPF